MPFIHSLPDNPPTTTFFLLRGATQHVGGSYVTHHLAETFIQQNKKVLIFDALLGLKNYPAKNQNTTKLVSVLQGANPLSDLITTDREIDIIAGCAQQNLNALSLTAQQKIKSELLKLAQNYQIVIIDCPASVTDSPFQDFDNVIYVSTPDQQTLLMTLQQIAKQKEQKIILNRVKNDSEYNQAYLFIKNLLPKCKIIKVFK